MAAVTCPHCGFEDAGRFCSNCGSSLVKEHSALRIVKVLFAPLFDYVAHAKDIFRPKRLADEVRAGRYDVARLFGFVASSLVISTIIDKILLPDLPETAIEKIPIVSEAIQAVTMIVASVVGTVPMHFALSRGGNKVNFGQYCATSITISALLGPWMNLIVDILFLMGHAVWIFIILIASQYVYVLAFSELYQKPKLTVTLWFAVSFVALIVLVMIIYGAVLIAYASG